MEHGCNHQCPMFDTKLAIQIAGDIAETRKQVEIYLGNGVPGIVPKAIAELKTVVDAHSEYIATQKGAAGEKSIDKSDRNTRRMTIFSLIASLGTLFGIAFHLWRMG